MYRQKTSFTHNTAISTERAVTFSLDTAKLITAGVRKSGTLYIYIDGVLHDSSTPASVNENSTSTLDIGARLGGNVGHFTGNVDDVRIYNYTLTSSQVKTIMNSGSAVNFAPITGSP